MVYAVGEVRRGAWGKIPTLEVVSCRGQGGLLSTLRHPNEQWAKPNKRLAIRCRAGYTHCFVASGTLTIT